MAAGAQTLKRTPLYDRHVAAGARLVPFAGWEMPVQYAGIRAEHTAVRERAGVFDVSHMGQVETSGPSGDPPAVTRLTGVGRPRIGGFARKGLKLTLRCGEVDGEAIARVRVSGKAARKLGRRTLATRAIECSPDAALTLRVKPSKAVRKAILNAGMRNLKVTLQVALPDGTVLKKTVALKRR